MLVIGISIWAFSRSAPNEVDPGRANKQERGRRAETPEQIPAKGLLDVIYRTYREVLDDRVMLVSAGVAFYLFLSIFPALAGLVSLYALIADPGDISLHLRDVGVFLPTGAFQLFADQIEVLAKRNDNTLGLTFFIGLGVAIWGTHRGTMAIFDAMNIAYEEKEKRGFIWLNFLGLAFTAAGIFASVAMVGLVAVLPVALTYVWLDQDIERAALILRWPLLLAFVLVGSSAVYRFGPSRQPAKLRWITWGAALTTLGWCGMSVGFSIYLDHFANYSATYGTLGVLIGFLVWLWLSIAILFIGGELNAELERQTEKDTTTGPALPMGVRGAYVADTVGESFRR
ncbi:YihY/virulence factor BrkB family protein [Rhizobium sp. Root1212]|uniref:YihY/virulence factor BrkB family protein n=1 Tax=Rhizobium sp. Root1212 TaxID=1736429 RepID=UPI001FCD8074|nr:YihY/virulence factor BrkB family protein [Rhizobium sp. Root1212]